jgi:hypothetical protein
VHDSGGIWGNEGITPLILNRGTGCRRVAGFTTQPLTPGEQAPITWNKWAGGSQCRSGRFGEKMDVNVIIKI